LYKKTAMYFIDTHIHLYDSEFDPDLELIINNAISKKITKFILPNLDSKTIDKMHHITHFYPEICYSALGLHPTSVNENYKTELNLIEQHIAQTNCVAIGEIGIDLYWDKTFYNQQVDAFIYQIQLAKKHQLPIIIHTRNSFNEVFEILDKHHTSTLKGVFHCFSGNAEQAQKILDYKTFKLGIGGVLTFKNSGLDKIITNMSLSDIVLETDGPYLAPVPYRGKRNIPEYLLLVANKLAEIKNTSTDIVAQITSQNAKSLFNI